jgi:hypothetical protein
LRIVRFAASIRMPAPFQSGTAAPMNSMFSIVTLSLLTTQIALPFEIANPVASIFARPPTPRIVRLSLPAPTLQASLVYVPASISTVSPAAAAANAAHGFAYVLPDPTWSVAPKATDGVKVRAISTARRLRLLD